MLKKKHCLYNIIIFFCCVLSSFTQSSEVVENSLEKQFSSPSLQYGPRVFWQWMNGNISKEGITLDLEAMREAGIGGGIIFNNATGIPRGPVDYGAEEWVNLTVFALQEADRLGMKFMLHNSPGYTSTGGPWITPDKSMQQLVWSKAAVNGKGKKEIQMPRPYAKKGYYKDAMVIAYPALPGEEEPMQEQLKKISVNGVEADHSKLIDFDFATTLLMTIPEDNGRAEMLLEFKEPFEARSIVLRREKTAPPHHPYDGPRDDPPTLTLESSADGIKFQKVATIPTPALRELETPSSKNFEAVKAKYFRIVSNKPTEISEVELFGFPRNEGWAAKANYQGHASYHPGVADVEERFVIDPDKVLDLSGQMSKEGLLTWEVPEGNWTVLRIGHTTTGEIQAAAPDAAVGLEVDKLSKAGLDAHFDGFLNNILEKLEPYKGKSFEGFMIDSWEVGVQNWTAGFDKEFAQRNDYNILPFLPGLTGRYVGGEAETNDFLQDFRRTQADMLAENYYGYFQERLEKEGLKLAAEPYGDGNFESLQVGTKLDRVFGEFWVHGLYGGATTNKMAGSIAHTNGLKIAGAEAYTAMPDMSKFTEYPSALKPDGDWMFTNGINHLYFHTSAHQSHPTVKPGMVMGPFGTHFNRNNNWFVEAKPWYDYLRRSQYLLQQGQFVADAAYFLGEEVVTAPNLDNPHPGHALDLLGRDLLLNDARVKDGKLVLSSGMTYPILVLPNEVNMSLEVLQKLKELMEQGLWVSAKKPKGIPGMNNKQEVRKWKRLVEELWGSESNKAVENSFGKGKLFSGIPTVDIFRKMQLPKDFDYTSDNPNSVINYIHRKAGQADYYFVANNRRNAEEIVASFRVEGKQPELWNPETGEIKPIAVYSEKNGITAVHLNLDPAESVFIVFRKPATAPAVSKLSKDGEVLVDLSKDSATPKLFPDLTNNFTVETWFKPDVIAFAHRGFLLYPQAGEELYGKNHATVGLSAGQNGVRVFEQTGKRPKQVLFAQQKVEGWTHVALVYQEGKPTLYINGKKAAEGEKSSLSVHPNLNELAPENPLITIFQGEQTSIKVHPDALSAEQLEELFAMGKPEKSGSAEVSFIEESGRQKAVFRENGRYTFQTSEGKKEIRIKEIQPDIEMEKPWRVQFPPNTGAPQEVQMDELGSLHEHPDFGVRHFSGTAKYFNSFKVPTGWLEKDKQIVLDLGEVAVIAKVLVNGKRVDILWNPPFQADITEFLKAGENELEVQVSNLWVNRLIGDEYLPEEIQYDEWGEISELPTWYTQGKEKPGERITFVAWKQYNKDGPLVQSGLVGPVKLKMLVEKDL